MVATRLPRGSGPLLLATLLSNLAVVLQVVAVGIQVFAITDSPLSLGLVGLAEFMPDLLLVPFTGGWLTATTGSGWRRWARPCTPCRPSCSPSHATTDPTSTIPIFGLVALFGVARAISGAGGGGPACGPRHRGDPAGPDRPAHHLLADRSDRRPVAAGFLYAGGRAAALRRGGRPGHVVGAGLPAGAPVPRPDVAPPGGLVMLKEASEGLRVVRRSPVLLGAISLDLFAVLFGGAVALIPAIAEDRLGVGEIGVGWLRAAVGIGEALTTLGLAIRPVTKQVGKVMMLSVGAFGVLTIVFGLTTNFAVAFVALAGLSAADAISVFVRSTLVPLVTPREVRGRVLAVENVFVGASNELGAFESGVVAAIIGAPLAVATGGAAVLVVVVLWWRWFPALPAVDRFTTLRPIDLSVLDPEAAPRPG